MGLTKSRTSRLDSADCATKRQCDCQRGKETFSESTTASYSKNGAGDGTRTRDVQLEKRVPLGRFPSHIISTLSSAGGHLMDRPFVPGDNSPSRLETAITMFWAIESDCALAACASSFPEHRAAVYKPCTRGRVFLRFLRCRRS